MNTNRAELVVADDLRMICEAASEQIRRLEGDSVLITGGGGFLGHYLVQALLEWNRTQAAEPIRVRVADNWMRGEPAWMNARRDDEHLEVLTLDITEPLADDFSIGNWVIHAASIASPIYYRVHPIETMDANVNGLRGLLDRACARRCERATRHALLLVVGGLRRPDARGHPHPRDYTRPGELHRAARLL